MLRPVAGRRSEQGTQKQWMQHNMNYLPTEISERDPRSLRASSKYAAQGKWLIYPVYIPVRAKADVSTHRNAISYRLISTIYRIHFGSIPNPLFLLFARCWMMNKSCVHSLDNNINVPFQLLIDVEFWSHFFFPQLKKYIFLGHCIVFALTFATKISGSANSAARNHFFSNFFGPN